VRRVDDFFASLSRRIRRTIPADPRIPREAAVSSRRLRWIRVAIERQVAGPPVEVHLVERFEIFRAALRALLEGDDRFVVAGVHTSCDALLRTTDPAGAVVLVCCDLDDHPTDASLIAKMAETARVVLLSADVTPTTQLRAAQLGAAGVVAKDLAPSVLFNAIDRVHHGEAWFERSTIAAVIASHRARIENAPSSESVGIESLTKREREVIGAVAQGLRNRDIADRLFISDATVRHHLTSVFGKLGVSDRLQLLIFAFRHGLANPDG